VLEEQSFQPIGAQTGVRVDVRVITATDKNLQGEIAAARFREDLFYRLNVIPFFVPPLRERREDIPILARYFMRVFSAEHGRGPKEFSSEALDMLVDYSWPGNVRELRDEIERLVATGGLGLAQQQHPEGEGKKLLQDRCRSCHSLDPVLSRKSSHDEWQQLVVEMLGYGAELKDKEIDVAVDYLTKYFGAQSSGD